MSTDPDWTFPDPWPILEARARARVNAYIPQNNPREGILKPALNAFLTFLPEGGRESMAEDILKAKLDDELREHFNHVFRSLLVPMKLEVRPCSYYRNTYVPRYVKWLQTAEELEVPGYPSSPDIARSPVFRHLLLRRDSFKCMVTGKIDTNYWEEIGSPKNVDFVKTEGIHIMPFSFISDESTDKNAGLASLYRYFPEVKKCGLTDNTINDPFNGITMCDLFGTHFEHFDIAFKHDGILGSNTYEIKIVGVLGTAYRELLPKRNWVHFHQAPGTSHIPPVPLPSPALLECHWRMAETFNACHINKEIEDYKFELEETGGTDWYKSRQESTNMASIDSMKRDLEALEARESLRRAHHDLGINAA